MLSTSKQYVSVCVHVAVVLCVYQLCFEPISPLSEVAVRANAGTGATRVSGDDSRDRIRSQLREQLSPTYASMEKKYGLVWNAD